MDLLSLTLSLVRRNPYPLFSFMRRYKPVLHIKKYKLSLVFGFDDVRRVLTDHATFSSDFSRLAGAEAMDNPQMRASLVSSDPPVHTKLRGLVTRAFTARAVANLEPRIASLTHEMLDQVIETGRMDLVEDCNENVKSRGIYETPGGTLITTAHRELESLVLDRQTRHQKEILAINYAQLVYDGHWFSPLREALDAFFAKTNEKVKGSITLSLYKGNIVVKSRKSPNSLYRADVASLAAQAHL